MTIKKNKIYARIIIEHRIIFFLTCIYLFTTVTKKAQPVNVRM